MFIKDRDNNLRRCCDITGGGEGRYWVVKRAMRLRGGQTAYLVHNRKTKEWRTAVAESITGRNLPLMTDLY